MQKKNHLLLGVLIVLLAGGIGLLLSQALGAGGEIPTVQWDPGDEEVLPEPESESLLAEVEGEPGLERTTVELAAGEVEEAGSIERVPVTLRGRVVDSYRRPVPGARVSLEIGRGGRRGGFGRRRIPDPVVTAADGTFAFRGEVFRVLRINLLIRHEEFAPALIDRNLGTIEEEVDLGDLAVTEGGAAVGRVTDLEGNGIAGATLELQPQGANPLRWVPDRAEVLPPRSADQNGFFLLNLVPPGTYRILATAPHRQRGGSQNFEIEEGRKTELPDIRLGPGFELAGAVYDSAGAPIANAQVEARPARGGAHRGRTTRDGRFLIEHLPGQLLTVQVQADGYLTWRAEQIDPKTGAPLTVTMQDGLRITGLVSDGITGEPVTSYAIRASKVRDLPTPAAEAERQQLEAERQALQRALARLREQGLQGDELRQRARNMQERIRRARDGARDNPRGRGNRPRGRGNRGNFFGRRGGDLGKPASHPDGTFELRGLQEGIYVVDVESPHHVRHRTAEFELRADQGTPHLEIALARGFAVTGVVVASDGQPVTGARVELREVLEPGAPSDGPRWLPQPAGPRLGARVLDATTGPRGEFLLEHAPEGRFAVRATASGFAPVDSEPFSLNADLQGLELELGDLGSLHGHVAGIPAGREAEVQVVAFPVGTPVMRFRGGRPFVQVDADGNYRFDELAPGGYLVRAFLGSAGDFLRQEFMNLSRNGPPQADVAVEAGKTAKLDLVVRIPEVGSLSGTVMHNLEPAAGFRVQLRGVNQGGQGGAWGRFGRNFTQTTSSSGRFVFEDLPAGEYDLVVSPSRRGGEVYRERVFVVAFQEQVRDIAFQTGTLEGRVVDPEAAENANLRGNAQWLPGIVEVPEDLAAWRRENRVFNAPVRDGSFRFEMLPPGQGLVLVNLRGRPRATATAVVSSGTVSTVEVQAGKPK